jgi:hypothetical protein
MKQLLGLKFEMIETNAVVNATGGMKSDCSANTRASDWGYQPGFNSLDGIIYKS